MIDFLRDHARAVKISILFGIFNVILPLVLVTWFLGRATDVRHPFINSQPRDEIHPWLTFLAFLVLLTVVSFVQIRWLRITRASISTYYFPCVLALGFVTINLLIPAWLIGWAMQDIADPVLGIFSDPPNPANPARSYFRLIFAFAISLLIFSTEILAVRSWARNR